MWMIWIMVAMLSVAGYYSTSLKTEHTAPIAEMRDENLANNMAVYRGMVMRYLARHPEITGPATVSSESLEAERPAWYAPSPLWRNHLSADGMITVYAATLPTSRITPEIAKLSQRSILAGETSAALAPGFLYSPNFGNTGIPLPADVAIPDGSPVWMARRTRS